MVDIDGTDSFKGNSMTDDIDKVVVWTGTALPVGAANKVPQNGKFLLLDSLSAPTTATWYIQTSAILSSPNFVELPSGIGQAGDQVYPLSTTIGDYSIPSAVGISSNSSPTFQDDFSGADNFSDTGTDCLVDTTDDRIEWNADQATVAGTSYDLTSVSDTAWLLRFKLIISNFTHNSDGTQQKLFMGMSSHPHSTPANSSQDFAGFQLQTSSGGDLISITASDGAGIGNGTNLTQPLTATTYYCEIIRTTATNITVNLYSDPAFTVLVETKSLTIASTVQTLRYLKFFVFEADGTSNGVLNGIIDDVFFYNSTTALNHANLKDNNTGTVSTTATQDKPTVGVDSGSAQDIVALAINLNRTLTTSTQIKIKLFASGIPSDSNIVRTINVSDFTDDTWRFIILPRPLTTVRYVNIEGDTGVLSINEVKYITKTEAQASRGIYHRYLDPTDATANSLDSN